MVLLIFFMLFVFFLWLWSRSDEKLKDEGVKGDAVFSDLSGTKTTSVMSDRVQVSNKYNLTGKPDRVEKAGRNRARIIEVKSGSAPRGGPYDNHKIQLACYAILVEENQGMRVDEGVIKYSDRNFTVRITPGLKRRVKKNIDEILQIRNSGKRPERNHCSRGKCRACEYSKTCPDPVV